MNKLGLQSLPTPKVHEFGMVNWMGLATLYKKEIKRFMRVGPQTLLAPVISNLLYMTVFVLAFSALRPDPKSFMAFLAPGLVMLGILNNSAANSSSSIMTGKLMGSISDVLMPPLSYFELAIGWIAGAATRGIIVALVTSLALSFMMGMVGVLSGIWAEKFDQLAVVNQFIILPLSFLSGTFYSIDVLPESFQELILLNPLFYFYFSN